MQILKDISKPTQSVPMMTVRQYLFWRHFFVQMGESTVDVEIPLTEQDCQNDGIEFIDIIDDVTRIRFDVLDFEEEMADEDRKKAIVPFQLAYAVSIHKAQGLEYRSVKVVIPSSNAEKITHGIFYTAITRAKEKLKIYWSSETMQEVVAGFSVDTSRQKSLAIIKEKLKQDKNT